MARRNASYVRTMAFRTWLILILFSGSGLVAVVLTQGSLLDQITKQSRVHEVENAGRVFAEQYPSNPGLLEETAFARGWRVMTLDEGLGVVERHDGFDIACRGARLDELSPLTDYTLALVDRLHAQLEGSGEEFASTVELSSAGDTDIVFYLAHLEGSDPAVRYMYISSVMLSTEPLLAGLRLQQMGVAGLVLILTIAAAFFLSRRIARPIADLTKGAQRLAHGDFSTEFAGHGFAETEQLAKTLNYASRELRTVDQDRKELLSNVSHDLKTPLTIIKIYAETIRDVTGGDAEKRQTHCETIIEEANRLTDMVNEIVEISRLESGVTNVVMEDVDVAECLRETLATFAILTENAGYKFDVDMVDQAPIIGNKHYTKRALYNLIGNAINYTGEDRYVGVRLTTTGGSVRFEVADHGPGIPTEKIATIWDRYYKSRSSHKRAVIGSGIGLSIVRHILTLHHATFGVTSAPDGGSRFWFEMELVTPGQTGDNHTPP
ncbi:MAG: HAMP domain-containing histidine kinase [Propionibacteriaceae bacterium]|jgi:signal transduction histidine kinase|nr:HAMP domain-containing histidine kinase [Propionibacteriaceae bacterium]